MAIEDLFNFGPPVTDAPQDSYDEQPVDEQPYQVADASGKTVKAPVVKGADPEFLGAVVKAAQELGTSPKHLLTVIGYESEGTYSPKIMGGAGGNYMGLIQFGPNERKQYGASADQSAADQMGAVVNYLKDRGFKPGMGLLDLYSTINAGRPGLYDRSDALNGGAPGTVADKVQSKMMALHAAKANALLANYHPGTADITGAASDAAPQPSQAMLDAIQQQTGMGGPGGIGQTNPTGLFPRQPVMYQEPAPVAAPVAAPVPYLNAEPASEPAAQPVQAPPPAVPEPPAAPPVAPPSAPPIIDPAKSAQALQAIVNEPAVEDKTATAAPPSVLNPDQGIAGSIEQPATPQVEQKPSYFDNAAKAGQYVAELARQGATGVISGVAGLPTGVASVAHALSPNTLIDKVRGQPDPVGEDLAKADEAMRSIGPLATGAPKPADPIQTGMRFLGEGYIPGSKWGTYGNWLYSAATGIIAPAVAKANETISKQDAEKLLFPGQGADLIGPQGAPYKTVMTMGGPTKIGADDRMLGVPLLGWIGLATAGALVAPALAAKASARFLPTFSARDVANAAPGTKAISNWADLGRTYDDTIAPFIRVAGRVGLDASTMEDVTNKFRIQTGGAANNLVNSAIAHGKMETPQFSFQSPVALADLEKYDSPAFRDYLHLRDTLDDIKTRERTIFASPTQAAQQAAIGPVTVRGETFASARQGISAFETADPNLKKAADDYFSVVKAVRDFNYKGQYGIMDKATYTDLMQHSKNYVPWMDESGNTKRIFDNTSDAVRVSPFVALKNEMKKTMLTRLENEPKADYISRMLTNPEGVQLYTEVTAAEKAANPNWNKQLVSFYEGGKKRYFTTDPFLADLHNLDPYAISSAGGQALYAAKRLVETTATGIGAPFFAITDAERGYFIAKQTTKEGLKAPSVIGTAMAVPAQFIPLVSKRMSDVLSKTSNGWLDSVIDPTTKQAMITRMADVYEKSFLAELESAGTHRASFLQHEAEFSPTMRQAFSKMTPGPLRELFGAYTDLLGAIHSAPSFDFAKKNRAAFSGPSELALASKQLTGNPQTIGQFSTGGNWAHPIRMERPLFGSDTAGMLATKGMQTYGFATEIGREGLPWWNMTTQGAKTIGAAYLANPAQFVTRMYMYQALPAAVLYCYARGLGWDDQGHSYIDYIMNGISEYDKSMNWHIPIPGSRVENMIRLPNYHEATLIPRLTMVAMDHLFRSDSGRSADAFLQAAYNLAGAKGAGFNVNNGAALLSTSEDVGNAMSAYAETTLTPPTPPWLNAALATQGMVMPNSVFMGGQTYTPKQDPYDQLGGMDKNIELIARSLGTGVADIAGSSYAAYTHTKEGFVEAVGNGIKAGVKRTVGKTPILREALGPDYMPPRSGNTEISKMAFDYEKDINNLSRYYRTWTRDGGVTQKTAMSKAGGEMVTQQLGPAPPGSRPGISQPPPTNPDYLGFMSLVYDRFNRDTKQPDKNDPTREAGIGFKSLWKRYAQYSTDMKSLRNVDDGFNHAWQLELSQKPEQLALLKENHIDTKNIREVRNFFEAKRQEVLREIVFTVRAVEDEVSQRAGHRITLKSLDPYGKPTVGIAAPPPVGTPDVMKATPTVPLWYDGSDSGGQ